MFDVLKDNGDHFLVQKKGQDQPFKVAKTGLSENVIQKINDLGAEKPKLASDYQFHTLTPNEQEQIAKQDQEAKQAKLDFYKQNYMPLFPGDKELAGAEAESKAIAQMQMDEGTKAANAINAPIPPPSQAEIMKYENEAKKQSLGIASPEQAGTLQKPIPYQTPAADDERGNIASQEQAIKLLQNLKGMSHADQGVQPYNPYDAYSNLVKAPMAAMQAAATGQQQAARANNELANNQARDLVGYQSQILDNNKAMQTEFDSWKKAYMDQKIKPNRIWSDASTESKVGAIIGLMFSGIGSALTGQENYAMATINKFIERDIEAQKLEMDKSENLLSAMFKKYGSMETAINAAMGIQSSIFSAKLQAINANVSALQNQAVISGNMAQLGMQAESYKMQAATFMAKARAYRGEPMSDDEAARVKMMDDAIGKRVVTVGNNKNYLAATDEEAVKIRNIQSSLPVVIDTIKEINKHISAGSWAMKGSVIEGLRNQLATAAAALKSQLAGIQGINEQEIHKTLDAVADPSKFWNLYNSLEKNNNFVKELIFASEMAKSQHLTGYKSVVAHEKKGLGGW